MGRGGRRAGAGRKPGSTRGTVLRMDGTRQPTGPELPPAVPVDAQASLREPPADLLAAAQPCWRAWVDLALAERTLTPATVPGFRELCLRMAAVQALDTRIAELGIATTEALPYQRERRGWAGQLAVSLKDFKLTAFGKPATSDKPKAAANPWAQVTG
jgi:hypothetical protein